MDAAHVAETRADSNRGRARVFLWVFGILSGGCLALIAVAMILAGRSNLLPPPPLTATACIDSKLEFLRRTDLGQINVLAVGSSATWRNLDFSVLQRHFPGIHAVNAAPCFLHVDQTEFLTRFLLDRAPQVQTVMLVTHPRDFEACDPTQQRIFDVRLADAYFDGIAPRWVVYVTGFRPYYFLREIRLRLLGEDPDGPSIDDKYGSSILTAANPWNPAPVIDEHCFAALARLRDAVNAKGATLVVATLPVMPAWSRDYDPTGTVMVAWVNRLKRELTGPQALLIDGRLLALGNDAFADPVHLIYPFHIRYSEFLAGWLSQAGWIPPAAL